MNFWAFADRNPWLALGLVVTAGAAAIIVAAILAPSSRGPCICPSAEVRLDAGGRGPRTPAAPEEGSADR